MTQLEQLCGGTWFKILSDCRSATRIHNEPGITFSIIGFRIVCNDAQPTHHDSN